MNQDEIIAMAREAGFRTGHIDLTIGDPVPFIAPASGTSCIVEVQRFAALVAAKEREACALVCDRMAQDAALSNRRRCDADALARSIRARGQKEGA